MGIELLTERHKDQIAGVLGCWDRVLIFGTLPKICYAEGMTSYLYARQVRIFDYPRFAEPFREQLRENAERLAGDSGIGIEFLRKRNVRKEDRVKQILAQRGEHPGLVCVLSAMEPCSTYKPWHDKQTGKTYLRPDGGKCLHYYFYFIDDELELCYVRVPKWLPCRLQIYFNGHIWLAWPVAETEHRLQARRQRVCGDRELDACPADRRRLGDQAGSLKLIARFTAPSAWPITGAWISASTPPTSRSGSRPIWRPSTAT